MDFFEVMFFVSIKLFGILKAQTNGWNFHFFYINIYNIFHLKIIIYQHRSFDPTKFSSDLNKTSLSNAVFL